MKGLFSPTPVAVARYRSPEMERTITSLRASQDYDAVVCDFLAPAPNISSLSGAILFQHNVETMIWRRHAESAADAAQKRYFELQAKRMFAYEKYVCGSVRHVIAVSPVDAQTMRELFGLAEVSHIGTGVDVEYFSPPDPPPPAAGLIFLGSMDWLPNIDAVRYFVGEILPLIRRRCPEVPVAIVGRDPSAEIREMARRDPYIHVSGTVSDVRPYLWGSLVSVVPLRIGGGTRLKIYESMAARVPVVSTAIGAEGLTVHPPQDIRIADTPDAFAAECVQLLQNDRARCSLADAGWSLVNAKFSWDQIAADFENILESQSSLAGYSVQR
jgi:glycosyltransferase involved in cell wall biosynthesis